MVVTPALIASRSPSKSTQHLFGTKKLCSLTRRACRLIALNDTLCPGRPAWLSNNWRCVHWSTCHCRDNDYRAGAARLISNHPDIRHSCGLQVVARTPEGGRPDCTRLSSSSIQKGLSSSQSTNQRDLLLVRFRLVLSDSRETIG